MFTVFLLLVLVPLAMPIGRVSAQGNYSISQVDHVIEVMSTGQAVIRDTIHVAGQVTDGFMIGLPSRFGADVLKVVAYDDNNSYPVNTGVQLGDQTGFYGVSVDFNGHSPTSFTVAFLMGSDILQYQDFTHYFVLDYPAYPSLTQTAADCNTTISLPSNPGTFNITKNDGFVNGNYYNKQNLAPYNTLNGLAYFNIAYGTLYIADISQLSRDITVNPSGSITASDKYTITNNSTVTMASFVLDVPTSATKIQVTDQFGRQLITEVAGTINFGSSDVSLDSLLINATLVTLVPIGQTAILTAIYQLPSATLQGSDYVLKNFRLYPDIFYYVDHAIITITPPEGATIVSPQISSLDSSASLTRSSFQDSLTVVKDKISYLDYAVPNSNTIQFSYSYNPVWVSFRPTFWLSLLAVVGCGVTFFFRRRKQNEKDETVAKLEKLPAAKTVQAISPQQGKAAESASTQHLTTENIKEFAGAYEEKKELTAELRILDSRAQKGKIPRRQYKVQRKTIENRLETLSANIENLKELFRNAGQANAELMRQLDSAEEDLTDADENINSLESRQKSGEISLETYKEEIGDYQKQKDKAESTINGILLRLREKTR